MTKIVTVAAQQKWEYLALTRKSESYLIGEINLLGQDGWELVSVFYYKDMKGLWCWTGFLKRPSTGQAAPPPPVPVAEKAEASAAPEGSAPADGFDLDGDEFRVRAE
jgi:hypothetical protein